MFQSDIFVISEELSKESSERLKLKKLLKMNLLITGEMHDIAISLVINGDSTTLQYESFARGYYVYLNSKDSPLIGEN